MRTVFPNIRAVGAFALLAFSLIFLTFSFYRTSSFSTRSAADLSPGFTQSDRVAVARDLHARLVHKSAIIDASPQANSPPLENSPPKNPNAVKTPPKVDPIPAAPAITANVADQIKNQQGAAEKVNHKDESNAIEVHAPKISERKVIAEPPRPSEDDLIDAKRREKIMEMTRHAWYGYRNFTWGANELKPISKRPHSQPIFGGSGMMATIIDGADTLWIMGLRQEYNQAREHIVSFFNVSKVASSPLSVFEVTIRHIGGLLSLHALTGEQVYVDKAKELTDLILPAFDTPSGIPKSIVDPKKRTSLNYGWAAGGSSILAEFGSLHIEFAYLSALTGNLTYKDKVNKVRDVLDAANKKDGLYSNYMSPETGRFVGSHISVGALGDSFYELLLKAWVWSGRTDEKAYRMYKDASAAIRKKLVFKSKGGLTYLAELRNGVPDHKMSHLACFSPGMFALEADVETDTGKKAEVLELAEALGHTCHESYNRSATGIGPEMFYFEENSEAMTRSGDSGYILRPEAIEGWFYLWRITRKKKYKEWVWDAVMAIEKHCRVENGFAGLHNVYRAEEGYDDVQQTFFLAETLKYAYLTFADREMSLQKWVFNTEAHPMPVQQIAPKP